MGWISKKANRHDATCCLTRSASSACKVLTPTEPRNFSLLASVEPTNSRDLLCSFQAPWQSHLSPDPAWLRTTKVFLIVLVSKVLNFSSSLALYFAVQLFTHRRGATTTMLALILSSLVLATSALAAPLGVFSTFPTLGTRQENNSNSFNITYQSPSGSEYDGLPRLLIVATGGCLSTVFRCLSAN